MLASLTGLRNRLHSIGVSVSDTHPDTRIATAIVTPNSWNSIPINPPMNMIGMNTAESDVVMVTMVEPDLGRPFERRLEARLSHLHVADDVLEHHDGIIDDEAHGQGQRHEREVVDAVVEQVHHREGADDGHGEREARDDGSRDVAQEGEDHQHHEHERDNRA